MIGKRLALFALFFVLAANIGCCRMAHRWCPARSYGPPAAPAYGGACCPPCPCPVPSGYQPVPNAGNVPPPPQYQRNYGACCPTQ